ncbi:Anoctamin-1 [Liparis tanakae]|uniref:Anoctamin-1 n=1 Tax=Liparis tanakae TaxID=230148 RepID=A0A4Z2FI02_9TELE|nr:Anoctamin-1 [Liparis tanakae]
MTYSLYSPQCMVYQYMYSPDGSMHGFVNNTLSYFNVSHFQQGKEPMDPQYLGYPVEMCRYKDYREPPWSDTPYEISKEFWAVLAVRLAFVIVFQNRLSEPSFVRSLNVSRASLDPSKRNGVT